MIITYNTLTDKKEMIYMAERAEALYKEHYGLYEDYCEDGGKYYLLITDQCILVKTKDYATHLIEKDLETNKSRYEYLYIDSVKRDIHISRRPKKKEEVVYDSQLLPL